jgi:GntR family transcriptional regulator
MHNVAVEVQGVNVIELTGRARKESAVPVTPVYQRIVEDILARIASGEWPPGHKLPPPAALADMYEQIWADERIEVSPQTVRRSTDTLQIRGVLVGRQGVGVFVAQP